MPAVPLSPTHAVQPSSNTLCDTLCDIARRAAHEILAVYATDFAVQHKDDASPVTEADLRADRVIRAGLEQAFAGVFIWSEESQRALPAPAPTRFFLVDPLDGTKEFLKRNGEFTVNIALIEHGRAVAAVVLAPALGELFWAAEGLGAFKGKLDGSDLQRLGRDPAQHRGTGKSAPTPERDDTTPLRVIGSRSHGLGALDDWLAALKRPHRFVATGSSLKFCRIAEGAADVYPRFGPTSQWDTAAGQCVLEQAGGCVLDAQGAPLRYALDRPLINPDFVAWGAGVPRG